MATGSSYVPPSNVKKILTPSEMAAQLLALPTMVEEAKNLRQKVLAYGDPFTGKTTLAALMAEFYYILWCDGDNGLSAIKNNLPEALQKRIIPVKFPASTADTTFMHSMLRLLNGRQCNLCLPHGSIDCPLCKGHEGKTFELSFDSMPANWIVVMDNQTQFAMCAYAHSILKANPKEKETPIDYKMERDDWGIGKNVMDKEQAYIKDLRCNFITISHGTMVEMENKKNKIVPVGGSDKVSRQFAKAFDHQVYCELKNLKHTYSSSTTYANDIQTGSRSNVALEKQKVPSLLHFFKTDDAEDLLKGSYTEWFFSDRKVPAPKPKEVLQDG